MYSTPETEKVAEALADENIGETLRCYLLERKKSGKGPGDYRDFISWAGYESMVTEDGTRLVSRKVNDRELYPIMQRVYDSITIESKPCICGNCAKFCKFDTISGVGVGMCMNVDAVIYSAADDMAEGGDCECFASDLERYFCRSTDDARYCDDYEESED